MSTTVNVDGIVKNIEDISTRYENYILVDKWGRQHKKGPVLVQDLYTIPATGWGVGWDPCFVLNIKHQLMDDVYSIVLDKIFKGNNKDIQNKILEYILFYRYEAPKERYILWRPHDYIEDRDFLYTYIK